MLPVLIPAAVVIGLGSMFYGAVDYYNTNLSKFDGICNNYALRYDLNKNIYGQSDAIDHLTDALSSRLYYGVHVLLLVGGPGVGKTYTASIIRRHYQPPDMITYIVPSLQPFNEALLTKTKHKISRVTGGFSLIIIDGIDFKNKDLMDFIEKLEFYSRTRRLVVKVIIIGEVMKTYSFLFGYQSVTSFGSIQEYVNFVTAAGKDAQNIFKNKIHTSVILFMPVSINVLKQCMNNAIQTHNRKPLTDEQFNECLDQIRGENSDFAFTGCKDVDAYVSMYDYTQFPLGFTKLKEACPYPYWICMLFMGTV